MEKNIPRPACVLKISLHYAVIRVRVSPCLVPPKISKSVTIFVTLNVDEKKINCTVWWEIARRMF